MFIVRPLRYKLNFLHLHTLKIGLKIHACVLKILGLAMPMHMSTFRQDFPQLNFKVGAPTGPLKIAYAWLYIIDVSAWIVLECGFHFKIGTGFQFLWDCAKFW